VNKIAQRSRDSDVASAWETPETERSASVAELRTPPRRPRRGVQSAVVAIRWSCVGDDKHLAVCTRLLEHPQHPGRHGYRLRVVQEDLLALLAGDASVCQARAQVA
jgi:hypothetical protein